MAKYLSEADVQEIEDIMEEALKALTPENLETYHLMVYYKQELLERYRQNPVRDVPCRSFQEDLEYLKHLRKMMNTSPPSSH